MPNIAPIQRILDDARVLTLTTLTKFDWSKINRTVEILWRLSV